MAKRLFYACAGLMMLAAAYNLGATTAESQAPGNVPIGLGTRPRYEGVGRDDVFVVTSLGNVFCAQHFPTGFPYAWVELARVPSTSPIAAFGTNGVGFEGNNGEYGYFFAVNENGDVFWSHDPFDPSTPWYEVGNIFGPEAIESKSWGAVKDRFGR